jgi:hypothetical protein
LDRGGKEVIQFTLSTEPQTFNDRCRKRGKDWLDANPIYKRPKDYWTEFEGDLRAAFRGLCGYCAMRIMKGHVDHFVPVAVLKESRRDTEAYEWSNFRYGDGTINGRKWKHLVLDPFVVKPGWFRIILPSLQLEMTDAIPQNHRALAEFTITQLGLRDDEVVIRYRQEWFSMYQRRRLDIEGLREVAPLIADAVQFDLDSGKDWRQASGVT